MLFRSKGARDAAPDRSQRDRSRPMLKLGETAQERAEQQREALAWGLETGAVHAVVQAYRQARDRGESELTAFNAAADAALALGRPLDKINDTARVLISGRKRITRSASPGSSVDAKCEPQLRELMRGLGSVLNKDSQKKADVIQASKLLGAWYGQGLLVE